MIRSAIAVSAKSNRNPKYELSYVNFISLKVQLCYVSYHAKLFQKADSIKSSNFLPINYL